MKDFFSSFTQHLRENVRSALDSLISADKLRAVRAERRSGVSYVRSIDSSTIYRFTHMRSTMKYD